MHARAGWKAGQLHTKKQTKHPFLNHAACLHDARVPRISLRVLSPLCPFSSFLSFSLPSPAVRLPCARRLCPLPLPQQPRLLGCRQKERRAEGEGGKARRGGSVRGVGCPLGVLPFVARMDVRLAVRRAEGGWRPAAGLAALQRAEPAAAEGKGRGERGGDDRERKGGARMPALGGRFEQPRERRSCGSNAEDSAAASPLTAARVFDRRDFPASCAPRTRHARLPPPAPRARCGTHATRDTCAVLAFACLPRCGGPDSFEPEADCAHDGRQQTCRGTGAG
jgi:hypothetical protein